MSGFPSILKSAMKDAAGELPPGIGISQVESKRIPPMVPPLRRTVIFSPLWLVTTKSGFRSPSISPAVTLIPSAPDGAIAAEKLIEPTVDVFLRTLSVYQGETASTRSGLPSQSRSDAVIETVYEASSAPWEALNEMEPEELMFLS